MIFQGSLGKTLSPRFPTTSMLNFLTIYTFFNQLYVGATELKPIFFKKPCFLFFVIGFSYIAHCLNLVTTHLLNICLIAEAELHS